MWCTLSLSMTLLYRADTMVLVVTKRLSAICFELFPSATSFRTSHSRSAQGLTPVRIGSKRAQPFNGKQCLDFLAQVSLATHHGVNRLCEFLNGSRLKEVAGGARGQHVLNHLPGAMHRQGDDFRLRGKPPNFSRMASMPLRSGIVTSRMTTSGLSFFLAISMVCRPAPASPRITRSASIPRNSRRPCARPGGRLQAGCEWPCPTFVDSDAVNML